ncbi:hypothetical protein DXV65_20510 [Pseudomonas fluorescens]|jgi:hypothetical protein|nr:hypothetical protein DXV65_20510 [Pseudomonas fluorescens]
MIKGGAFPACALGWRHSSMGGAMGLYGDFLFSATSQGGSSPLAALGGPIAGDLEAIFKLKDNAADGEVNQTGGSWCAWPRAICLARTSGTPRPQPIT